MYSDTVSSLRPFIIHQSLFCMERGYLIPSAITRAACKLVSYSIIIIIATLNTKEILEHGKGDTFLRTFEFLLIFEHILLFVGANIKGSAFKIIKDMDEHFGMDDEYCRFLNHKMKLLTIVSIILAIVDAANLMLLPIITPAMAVSVWAAFAAHNSDLLFYGALVDGLNVRLARLKNKIPKEGALDYRYILIGTYHLNSEFNSRMFVILTVTFISTLIYLLMLIVRGMAVVNGLTMVIISREVSSMGSLWFLCSATTRTECQSDELSAHIAGRFALPYSNQGVLKDYDQSQRRLLRRWLLCISYEKPYYYAGESLTLNLTTPSNLLDVSATYLLILLQMYIDNKL